MVAGRHVIILSALLLAGCAPLHDGLPGPETAIFSDGKVNPASANGLIRQIRTHRDDQGRPWTSDEVSDQVTDEDLFRLLCPGSELGKNKGGAVQQGLACFLARQERAIAAAGRSGADVGLAISDAQRSIVEARQSVADAGTALSGNKKAVAALGHLTGEAGTSLQGAADRLNGLDVTKQDPRAPLIGAMHSLDRATTLLSSARQIFVLKSITIAPAANVSWDMAWQSLELARRAVAEAQAAARSSEDGKAAQDRVLDEYKRQRNTIQYSLMLASDQRCGLWITYLMRAGAINRGTFSVLSTISGGLAPLVGSAGKAFGAVSGISSGTGSAVDAAMLHGLTEGVVIPKVLSVRADMKVKIEAHLAESPTAYPISRALSDVIAYHNLCSVSTALNPAADTSIRAFTTPVHKPGPGDMKVGTRIAQEGSYLIITKVDVDTDDPSKTKITYAQGGEVVIGKSLPSEAQSAFLDRVASGYVF